MTDSLPGLGTVPHAARRYCVDGCGCMVRLSIQLLYLLKRSGDGVKKSCPRQTPTFARPWSSRLHCPSPLGVFEAFTRWTQNLHSS